MNILEKLGEGGAVTLLGMGTVFAVLILLWGILELMRVFFYDIPNKRKAQEQPALKTPEPAPAPVAAFAPVIAEEDDSELVAVITAAISNETGKPASGFVVRSIRRTRAWNTYGDKI